MSRVRRAWERARRTDSDPLSPQDREDMKAITAETGGKMIAHCSPR